MSGYGLPPVISESIDSVLQSLSSELEHLDELIRELLEQHPELKKDFDLLTSIKFVGFQLGLNMLVILRSHRFDTAEQAAAFLGVVPVPALRSVGGRGYLKSAHRKSGQSCIWHRCVV